MIKLLLMIGIMGVSTGIGLSIKTYYNARYQFYLGFKSVLQDIKSEILFLKTDKHIILSKLSTKSKAVTGFIKGYLEAGIGCNNILTSEENEDINNILDSIGKNDVEGELNNLDYSLLGINKKYNDTLDKYDRYGGFAVKLSIVIGALVVIFLI